MPPSRIPAQPKAALAALRRADPKLGAAIDAVGPFAMAESNADLRALCRVILGQQLSVAVASAIAKRFDALHDNDVTPDRIHSITDEQFRAAGLSGAKTRGVRALATFWHEEKLSAETFHAMEDEEIIKLLTRVKGIGPWTAKIFMLFSLRRPDVLPVEDLGLRMGYRKIHGLAEMPTTKELENLCEKWRPWRSVATWYCWQVLKVK